MENNETFFSRLDKKSYPPEVIAAINKLALKRATGYSDQNGEYELEPGCFPVLGLDHRVRGPWSFGAQGNGAELVDLIPQVDIEQLFSELPPELQGLCSQ
ncbi:MAG: hypothetical protein UV63_C0033G0004 [Microgenomates group bacterium GW2011_GWC1_43_11]|nr:MAG: hypothetical protein UV63_C0033G0004 [Microgenomates group bacterium GW2011_GWC1_43_11]HCM82119.1 hypothetical protein [Patescibacteria group bacterium]